MQPPLGPAPGPAQQAVAAFDWPVISPVPGLHSLQPDVGQQRWTKSTAGALNCKWSCGECSKTATNSSRLFELLRTPCGEQPGEWRQLMHAAAVQGDKVVCTRCSTTRQPHIQLQLQKCPVRGFFRELEDPAASGVYAAWHQTVRAMHAFAKAATAVPEETLVAADAGPAEAQAGGAAAELPEVEPGAVPVPLARRPFGSHVVRPGCIMQPQYQLPYTTILQIVFSNTVLQHEGWPVQAQIQIQTLQSSRSHLPLRMALNVKHTKPNHAEPTFSILEDRPVLHHHGPHALL